MSFTRINIRINPDTNGVIVNTNDLTQNERLKKNALYTPQVPQKDPSQSRNQKKSKEKKPNDTVSTKPDKSKYQPTTKQIQEMQRQTNQYSKELSQNQASLGMIYTSNQILKQQNQILYQNQKAINELVNQNKNSAQNPQTQPMTRKNQQQQLKNATQSVNNQLQEIRKIRDQIVKTAKQVSQQLGSLKKGKIQMPSNLTHMNQNLKNLAQNSIKHIDMLSPQKFQLVGKIQNFNIDGYTQHLNQLKKQINDMQRQSQNVQKQLRQRVSQLEKVKVSPQFQAQLLEPYEKNIKQRLATIDLQETKKKVYDRLGQFDYFKINSQIDDISTSVRQEIWNFQLVCKQFKINVPILRFDQKEIKALELKLPSILDQYKEARGITLKRPEIKEKQKEKQKLQRQKLSSKGLINPIKKTDVQQIITKPKDLSNEIQYKKVVKDPYKTIFQAQSSLGPVQKQKRKVQQNIRVQNGAINKNIKDKEEEDFEAYLQNRKNQQLQLLYKEKRDQLRKMKQDLYEESTEPIARISLPRMRYPEEKQSIRMQYSQDKQKQEQSKINISKQEDSIGSRIFDPNEGAIKQIGKQVLKQKLKDMLKKPQQFSQSKPKERNYQPILPQQFQNPTSQQRVNGQPSINAFAQGFLTVINNTFAQMNRGLASNLQKRRPQVRSVEKPQANERVKIPFPQLQQIPKPPVFNLQFQLAPKHPVPMFPTFSNNLGAAFVSAPVRENNYTDIDVSVVDSYSEMDVDRSEVKSNISNIKSEISYKN